MFKTDWICILSSGATIDGREVSVQTLEQISETYDPNVYNARINIEHQNYGPKLGSVIAVKTEDQEGGGKKLFAKLKPNDYFLYLIQQGQKLHTSAEIITNFAKTGKAYLYGLAVTDAPASLGTTEMKFSVEGQNIETYSTSEVIPSKKPSLFKQLFTDQKEDIMTEKASLEFLSQIQAAQTMLNKSIETLSSNIERVEQQNKTASQEEKPLEADQEFSTLKDEVNTLKEQLSQTKQTVDSLTEELNKQTDEPERPQATGEFEAEVVL